MSSGVTGIYQSLGIVYPFLDVVVKVDLAVNDPGSSNVVGIYTIGIVYGRNRLIAFLLQLSCGCYESVPVSELGLDLSGIIGAEGFLGGFTVVDHNAGAALP